MIAGVRLHKLNYGRAFCLLVVLLSSCSSRQYQVLFQKKQSLTDSAYKTQDIVGEYRIKSQDILQVRNLQDARKYLINPAQSAAVNTSVLPDATGAGAAGDQTYRKVPGV